MLSDSDAVLGWAITHQSGPFPCPCSTGPEWIRRPREALAKDPLSTTPRAAVDIEDADTADGEVATERTVPVPTGFAAGACTWAVQSFIRGGSCVPSSRLGSVSGPLEPLAELPPPVRLLLLNPPGTTAPSWHALINVHGVPARLHPRQRKIGSEAVLKI